jgi:hypothetical protein
MEHAGVWLRRPRRLNAMQIQSLVINKYKKRQPFPPPAM